MSIEIIRSSEISENILNDIVDLVNSERKGPYTGKRLHTFDYYKWKLKNNPLGSYLVVNYSNETLMSFCTFTAKSNSILDNSVLYELGDVYIHNQVKGRGYFFRMLRKFHNEFPWIKVYGTPNSEALPSELKIGYKKTNINIKYRFMPLGLPIFHFLSNSIPFLKYFYKIDFLTKIFSKFFFIFVKNIKCKKLYDIKNLDSKLFCSDLFIKTNKYLLWRYSNSPENYKFLAVEEDNDLVIYKNIIFKNIPFIFIADHNICSLVKKKELLKQLLKKERVFGFFEMSASYESSFLPNLFSIKFKDIKLITYGDIIKKDFKVNNFKFLAGDTDNI